MRENMPGINYRLRRFYLILGTVGVICFLTMGIASTIVAYWNIDGSFRFPKQTAIFLAIFWSGPTMLSVWCILAYYRERLVLSETTVTKYNVFSKKEIPINDITRIQWVSMTGGTIVESHFERIKFNIDNFTENEQREISDFLRDTIATESQEKWSLFNKVKRDVSNPSLSVDTNYQIRYALILMFAGVFIYVWWMGMGFHYLIIGLLNLIVAIWSFHSRRQRQKNLQIENQEMEK